MYKKNIRVRKGALGGLIFDGSTDDQRECRASNMTAAVSADRRILELRAVRPIVAGPLQSYELWVIPEGGAPISLAVLGQLDETLRVPEAHVERLRKGALLAIAVEPAGGSPTGGPTGPVILAGAIS